MVIAARTGVGKSWTLIKIAVEGWAKQDLREAFTSGEMSADKVGLIIWTPFLGILTTSLLLDAQILILLLELRYALYGSTPSSV